MMKVASLVALSFFTAVLGLAPIADAAPSEQGLLGQQKAQEKKALAESFVSSKPAKFGTTAHGASQSAFSARGTISAQSAPTQSVPVPGTLLLFAAGFAALALWHHRSRRGISALPSSM